MFTEKVMRYAPLNEMNPWNLCDNSGVQSQEGLPTSSLEECSSTLYNFASELTRGDAQSIPILYTVVDTWASYNMIMGSALNKLGVVVSTLHLCMKYLVRMEVGIIWVDQGITCKCYEDSLRIDSQPFGSGGAIINVLDVDLDP
ncbi:hypothetical protein CR513_09173, partial [Mucuna pruriens]